MKDRLQMVPQMAKEHSKIVIKFIQVNGNVIYGMEEDNKYIKRRDIGIKVISLLINIMDMEFYKKKISLILDNLKKVFMMDKELLDIKLERLFQGFLEMGKKYQENIIYLMEVIMKDNIKKECLMEKDSLNGLTDYDIQAFGKKDCKMEKEVKYLMEDSKKVFGKMVIFCIGDDICK